MPMTSVEQLLSDIADYGEQLLRNRPDAQTELNGLLQAGQHPSVIRVCQQPRGALLAVAFDAEKP